jgi:hypothetical protein
MAGEFPRFALGIIDYMDINDYTRVTRTHFEKVYLYQTNGAITKAAHFYLRFCVILLNSNSNASGRVAKPASAVWTVWSARRRWSYVTLLFGGRFSALGA